MAIFDGTIFSQQLKMMTSLYVLLPENDTRRDEEGNVPVLYLLHGLSDNHSCWVRRTNVERYAEEAGIAVVIPEVQRSFYTDMCYGLPYFRYVAQELPALCQRLFRVSAKRENNMIAGLSMGGYGALKTAMTYPERFRAAASFSGAVELTEFVDRKEPENVAIYGDAILPENDLFGLTKSLAETGKEKPELYLTCGFSDFLYEENTHYRALLDRVGYSYTYEEWEGGHEWDFWDASIKKAIAWLTK